jgi:broad specificity phosphatase PhoE
MNKLYWVRHGESYANIIKVFSYKLADYSLTPKGRLQANQTADLFVNRNIHEIYSSPMKRARETAEIISDRLGLTFKLVENFLEVNIGKFDGCLMQSNRFAIHQTIITDWFNGKNKSRFPGGEDYEMLWERIRKGYEMILKDKEKRNIIIVGHGGSFKYTLKSLCQRINLQELYRNPLHNCSITEVIVQYKDGIINGELISLASNSHLSGDASKLISGLPKR